MRPGTLSPESILIEVLDRLGASRDYTIRISSWELVGWPADSVAALKSQRLLRRTRPATSTLCPGCEQQCAMPVYTVVDPPGPSGGPPDRWSFVVCDKRGDINRVPVEPERLIQWRSSADAVCDFVADCLGLRPSRKRIDPDGLVQIGMATGETRRRMLCLGRRQWELELTTGESAIALAEVVVFRRGRYGLKEAPIRRLVDASPAADPRYMPSRIRREARKQTTEARDEALRKAYLKLKRDRPGWSDVWYSRRIAKLEVAGGLSAETIRKRMKK